jgi:predicted PurR-regulated permease PerM
MVIAAAVVVVLVGLYLASGLVALLAMSVLVALLLSPLELRIRRSGRPAWLALSAAILAYIAVIVLVGLTVLIGVLALLRDLSSYQTGLESGLSTIVGSEQAAGDLANTVAGLVRTVAGAAAAAAVGIGYSVIIVAYMLLEAPRATDRLQWAFGEDSQVVSIAIALGLRLRRYVIARGVLGLVAAALDTVVLIILGIPLALLWGVFSFLMSWVPNVGFIVALVPPALLGLAVGGPVTCLMVVIAYSIINVAVDYFVQPRYIGTEVDLSPVVVTVSLLFWALVLGGAGAILAVPLTITVAALAEPFAGSRPVARLMANVISKRPVEPSLPIERGTG